MPKSSTSTTERAIRAERVRPYVMQLLKDKSLKEVADLLNISIGAVRNLKEGSTPQEETLLRIENWAEDRGLLGGAVQEETPEQAVAANMPDVSFLRPRARAIYDRAIGSYVTRRWPQPILERAAWDLVNYIMGANTLRSAGPGRPELTEDEQVMVLERTTQHVERAYGPNGVVRRF